MQKTLEKFQEFFKTLKLSFSATCLSETWCKSIDSTKYSTIGFMDINPFINQRWLQRKKTLYFFTKTQPQKSENQINGKGYDI